MTGTGSLAGGEAEIESLDEMWSRTLRRRMSDHFVSTAIAVLTGIVFGAALMFASLVEQLGPDSVSAGSRVLTVAAVIVAVLGAANLVRIRVRFRRDQDLVVRRSRPRGGSR